jgi:hypothetical protein
MPDPTEPKQITHLFKPGQSGNPSGRPKGSRNKDDHQELLESMTRVLHKKGDAGVEQFYDEHPVDFFKVYEKVSARYIPKEPLKVDVSHHIELQQTFHRHYQTAIQYLKSESIEESESVDG